MKAFKYILVFSFTLALFASCSTAFATEVVAKQAISTKAPLDTRIQTFAEKMADIYSIIVNKLDDQAERINRTIIRLDQGTDADLSDAKDQLAVARLKIKDARKSVASLNGTISAILKKGGSPRIELKEIRDEIGDISNKISDAHNALQYTIVMIKQEFGLSDEDTPNVSGFSTTTPTTTPITVQ